MAYSIQTAVSDGTLEVLDLSIKYMDKSHIFVYVDDVLVDGSAYSYVWLTDTRIQLVPAVANGSTLKVIRKTLTDEMWHEFSKGARFSTTSMDENFEQLLFLAQEYSEGIYISDFYSDVDLHLKRILNLGDPINDTDAINLKTLKEYLPNADLIPPILERIAEEEAKSAQLIAQGLAIEERVTAEENKSAQIIAQGLTIGNKVITGFDGTSVENNAWVHFAGRDTVGDGGGGPLRFLKGSTATANGVTIYAVTGGRLVREGWSVFGIDVRWAGAKLDGVTDDTAAIQAAINACIRAGYVIKAGAAAISAIVGKLIFPAGDCVISDSIKVTNGYGYVVETAGRGGTRLIWKGSGKVAFILEDCQDCKVHDLTVYADPSSTMLAGFQSLQNGSLSSVTPTANRFIDTAVIGNWVTQDAYLIDYTGSDANNDFHELVSPVAIGYTRAAVYINGLQSHVNYIRNANFNGGDLNFTTRVGQYGVYSTSASGTAAASFVVDGGAIGWHSVSDYYMSGGATNGAQVKNVSSENSDRLFVTAQVAASAPVLLENVRCASDGLNADGKMIKFGLSGNLTIIGGHYGTNGTTSASQPVIELTSNSAIYCHVTGAKFSYAKTGTGENSAQFSPIVVSGSMASYADIKLEQCDFTNIYNTTMASYLNNTGAGGSSFAMLGYYGESTYQLSHTSATTLTHIRPGYPNQKIRIMMTNTNTTIKHNSSVSGTGKIYLKSGSDFTPTLVPCILEFQWNVAFGRWVQL